MKKSKKIIPKNYRQFALLQQYFLGKPILEYILGQISTEKWQTLYSKDYSKKIWTPVNDWASLNLEKFKQDVEFLDRNQAPGQQTCWKLCEIKESEIFIEML